MLHAGFGVRTVQHWTGHESLEAMMRYLVPAADVLARLDPVPIMGATPFRLRASIWLLESFGQEQGLPDLAARCMGQKGAENALWSLFGKNTAL
jgi:hypothetical protein